MCSLVPRSVLRASKPVSTRARRPCPFLLRYKVEFQSDFGISQDSLKGLERWPELAQLGGKNFSAPEAVFEDAADGADAVFPADFFAFGIGAAVVGDGDLVDAGAGAGDLGDDLWLDAEAGFF